MAEQEGRIFNDSDKHTDTFIAMSTVRHTHTLRNTLNLYTETDFTVCTVTDTCMHLAIKYGVLSLLTDFPTTRNN